MHLYCCIGLYVYIYFKYIPSSLCGLLVSAVSFFTVALPGTRLCYFISWLLIGVNASRVLLKAPFDLQQQFSQAGSVKLDQKMWSEQCDNV